MRPLPTDNAEVHYKRGLSLQSLGEFGRALEAFDAAIVLDPGHAQAHNARGIALVNLDRAEDALVSFDRALECKPDYAECHNNKGIVLQEFGRLDAALASFDSAIALKTDNARAHNNRGTVLADLRRAEDAVRSYEKAIALDPGYAPAFYNRGMALHDLSRFDDALASFDRAIALRPAYAEAHHNRGAVLQDLLALDEAIRAYAAAIEIHPDRAESYANQAYCYLQMGRFTEGWRLHEWRKRLAVPVGNRSFPQPLWLGQEDISNRILFVHWEQGFGDTIQFSRYGKLLKAMGANVVMSVQEPLYRLLLQMSPEIGIIHQDEVPQRFDYHCPMMSLPLALATTLQTVPAERRYIAADDRLRRSFEAHLPSKTKPRVGVAWKGNATHRNDRHRSIDLGVLRPLFSPDAHWISLQYDAGQPREGSACPPEWPPELTSSATPWTDFADAAALIECLDLVITVDTSVAHLAGAMGKPVFVLLPFNSDWRWLLDRDESPWYPSARLFRQQRGESWADVVARVCLAVSRFLGRSA
jgi:tetratricopeptide (TPR) repeat protein